MSLKLYQGFALVGIASGIVTLGRLALGHDSSSQYCNWRGLCSDDGFIILQRVETNCQKELIQSIWFQ